MWKLNQVGVNDNFECEIDNSGIYTIINRKEVNDSHKGYCGLRIIIRVDIMEKNEPLVSFESEHTEALRKNVIQWIDKRYKISTEHAAYIGAEIERAGAINQYRVYCQR